MIRRETLFRPLVSALTAVGLCFTGKDDRGERMELVELPRTEHPFYFGAQVCYPLDLMRTRLTVQSGSYYRGIIHGTQRYTAEWPS
jgi:hypothetical protein